MTVASFPVIIWSTFWGDSPYSFQVINIVTLFLMVAYLFYYQFLINKIKKFDYTEDVFSSLSRIYGYLKFYLLHYRVIVWIILPAVFVLSAVLSYIETPNHENTIPMWSPQFWIFCSIMAFIALVIILIMHFLVNLIYGRKIKKLKGMIEELGSQN